MRVLSGKRPRRAAGQTASTNPMRVRWAQSFSGPIRGSWGSSTMWWPIMRLRLSRLCPGKCRVWAVGERVHARLAEAGLPLVGLFPVPNSVQAITPLVGRIQIESEAHRDEDQHAPLWVFHNRPLSGAIYEPVGQRLLPLDAQWRRNLAAIHWPTANLPEVMGDGTGTLRTLIREYLFISLFRACAESLASENASRLAAMQRADKNINDLLEQLNSTFHQLRQSGIDEELFDVISGFEALRESR